MPAPPPPDGAGIGGGGGASPPGGGGGGGGPLGAPVKGIGGGGGGADGAPESAPGMGGAGGASKDPGIGGGGGASCGTGVEGFESVLSMAESGRGGAMVPKRIEASCLALPAPVGALDSESDSSSLSEPAADHSSSSGRRRDCGPVKEGESGLAASCWAILWKGLVEGRALEGVSAGGEKGCVWGIGGGEKAGAADASEERFLK